jgi:hypothetical protein
MNRFVNALYWPAPDDVEILRISDNRPCKAVATEVRDDRADLQVVDSFGSKFVRLNVAIGRFSREPDHCVLA